jgi:hypothetical protein|tara:strand:- start:1514 stop:1774 length:261 start_codon:yes stop_codon:yes gene_type:complete
MKKYPLATILLLLLTTSINAQDGWKPENNINVDTYNPSSPNNSDDVLLNPNSPNNSDDPMNVPIDDGIIILLGLGIAYGIYKIKNK